MTDENHAGAAATAGEAVSNEAEDKITVDQEDEGADQEDKAAADQEARAAVEREAKLSAEPAHVLWVELATRITSQPLHYRTGDEETAAVSINGIFGKARTLMAENREATTFNERALELLNKQLRPYTTRWHGWMTEDEGKTGAGGGAVLKFRDEWVRRKFREELRELQRQVIGYVEAFRKMSQLQPVDPRYFNLKDHPLLLEELFQKYRTGEKPARMGDDIPLKIRTQVKLLGADSKGRTKEEIHSRILEAESKVIRDRRTLLFPKKAEECKKKAEEDVKAEEGAKVEEGKEMSEPVAHPENKGDTVFNPIGLALSGGGIRSATFCLGIVQALQRRSLFAQFDYLSTVSGGGYLGTFLSSYLGVDGEVLDKVEERVARDKYKTKEEVGVSDGEDVCVSNEGVADASHEGGADASHEGGVDVFTGADAGVSNEADADVSHEGVVDVSNEGVADVPHEGVAGVPTGVVAAASTEVPPPPPAEAVKGDWHWTNWWIVKKFHEYEEVTVSERAKDPMHRIADAFKTPEAGGAESIAMRHLRNRSRYLLNGGIWSLMKIAGVLATGFLTSALMLLTLPLAVAWVLKLVQLTKAGWLCEGVMYVSLGLLVVSWFVMPIFQRRAQGAKWDSVHTSARSIIENITLVFALILVISAGLTYGPEMVSRYEKGVVRVDEFFKHFNLFQPPKFVNVLFASVLPVLFGLLSKRRDGSVRVWAKWLFAFTAPVFFLLAFLVFSSQLGLGKNEARMGDIVWEAVASVVVATWAWLFLNINTFAPHRYYRNRLCECYLAIHGRQQRPWLKRRMEYYFHGVPDRGATDKIEGVGTLHRLPLSAMGSDPAAPYHLINATLNAEASKAGTLRGRNGDFFIFSKNYCGSPLTGYIPTTELERADRHVDLGTAMAISGAAASTNMGWKTLRQMRFLMTLFNVRLGYWMRRPGNPGRTRARSWLEGPGPLYFIREMLGGVHEKTAYVNLSDGGHLENLAVYELLRRQCKFIVCVDAGMEPRMECADLMRLQRYASIDLGIRMHFDPSDLTVLPTTYSRAYAVLVKIDYAPDERGGNEASEKLGWMLYLKLAVTGTEPHYVLDYRRENPAFPHQSTGDQLYDEAQFEAYRALGECAANSLFRKEIVGGEQPATITDWFQKLADSLLPDNDEAFIKNEGTGGGNPTGPV